MNIRDAIINLVMCLMINLWIRDHFETKSRDQFHEVINQYSL